MDIQGATGVNKDLEQNPLARILAAGQISHAYLLLGDGELVLSMGFWFARGLNCTAALEERQQGAPCEVCDACRKMLHGNHSALHHITAGNGKQYISIEQIRTMQQQAYLSHLEGHYQVFLLAAEQLREEAANGLLKVLEEPPAQTVFLLYAEKDLDILPTILSRCQIVRLQEGAAVAQEELLGKAADWLNDFSQISPDRLLSWGDKWDKDRQGLRAFLVAALQCVHETILQGVRQQEPGEAAGAIEPWLASAALLEEAVESLDKNVNQRLLLDVLVLQLKRLLGS